MKNFKLLKDNKGFTLVELLVVMIIIGIVTAVIYQLFTTSTRYIKSIEELNDYQNVTTDVLYRLRVELADRAYVESFDIGATESGSTLKYDPATYNTTNYGYIVTNPVVVNTDGTSSGGGATIRGVELDASSNVVRTNDEVIGVVSDNKNYKVQIAMRSEDTGLTTLGVTIVRTDYVNPDTGNYEPKNVYTQSTTMKLRSGKASSGQEVLRYSIAS